MSWYAEIIKSLRQEQGLSQRRLAALAGVHFNVIVRLELGHSCYIETLDKILNALDYELEAVHK